MPEKSDSKRKVEALERIADALEKLLALAEREIEEDDGQE